MLDSAIQQSTNPFVFRRSSLPWHLSAKMRWHKIMAQWPILLVEVSMRRFGSDLSSWVFRRAGITRQMSLLRVLSSVVGIVMMLIGSTLLLVASKYPIQNDILLALGGATLGAGLAILVSRLSSQDEELINIVAAGAMSKSSATSEEVRVFQRCWRLYHTTRTKRGVKDMNRGFVWIKADVDLTAPAPGKLLGRYKTTDPHSGSSNEYLIEGYVRRGIVVLHVFPGDGKGFEDIEATFTFPLVQMSAFVAYGSGYHMTYAGKGDYVQSPAILCPAEQDVLDDVLLGEVRESSNQYELDNVWWNNHRFKIMPRILSQFSQSYADVGKIEGHWRFRYHLVYEEVEDPAETLVIVRRSGARVLIHPANGATGSGHSRAIERPDVDPTNGTASLSWMAELRPIHPYCMTGRWWGVSKEEGDFRVLQSEGTMLLHVDVNDRGIYGLFAGRPGTAGRMFAAVAAVRVIEGETRKQEDERLRRMFDRASNSLARAARPQATASSAPANDPAIPAEGESTSPAISS
ncbi:hypothetical protein QTH91_14615 [Variovorax dokdonensis]|uniref:Uncharacterized protein n=1 Tax=Variovorax dokdonensis TaxID=344883 RepID=A0ABT7NCN8_9BURK|nr:hypothetical protein [Variovorax dokdonensis]MDM0045720.1 hypothetical protein [Variovorax dokdonensis]